MGLFGKLMCALVGVLLGLVVLLLVLLMPSMLFSWIIKLAFETKYTFWQITIGIDIVMSLLWLVKGGKK